MLKTSPEGRALSTRVGYNKDYLEIDKNVDGVLGPVG
jgi:hypothetical protein